MCLDVLRTYMCVDALHVCGCTTCVWMHYMCVDMYYMCLDALNGFAFPFYLFPFSFV